MIFISLDLVEFFEFKNIVNSFYSSIKNKETKIIDFSEKCIICVDESKQVILKCSVTFY